MITLISSSKSQWLLKRISQLFGVILLIAALVHIISLNWYIHRHPQFFVGQSLPQFLASELKNTLPFWCLMVGLFLLGAVSELGKKQQIGTRDFRCRPSGKSFSFLMVAANLCFLGYAVLHQSMFFTIFAVILLDATTLFLFWVVIVPDIMMRLGDKSFALARVYHGGREEKF